MSELAQTALVPSRSLAVRMARAALLDRHFYEEVEAEPRSIGQATAVVLLASVAGGIGGWLAGAAPLHVAIDLVEPIVLWLGGSVFSYMLGATFLRGPHTATDYAEVLRTVGFAFTPGCLRVLAAVPPPGLGLGLVLAADLWMLLAGVVAVRQACDFSTGRALATFGFAYALLWLCLGGMNLLTAGLVGA